MSKFGAISRAARRAAIKKSLGKNAPRRGMGDAYTIKNFRELEKAGSPKRPTTLRKRLDRPDVSDIYRDPRTQAAISRGIKEGQKGGPSFSAGGGRKPPGYWVDGQFVREGIAVEKLTPAERAARKKWFRQQAVKDVKRASPDGPRVWPVVAGTAPTYAYLGYQYYKNRNKNKR